MDDIFHHPVRIIATLFVGGLWGFVLLAFGLGLLKLVLQKSWVAARRLTRSLRFRRRVIASQVRTHVNPGFRMPDDMTLARWLHEAAPAEWPPAYPGEAVPDFGEFPLTEPEIEFF